MTDSIDTIFNGSNHFRQITELSDHSISIKLIQFDEFDYCGFVYSKHDRVVFKIFNAHSFKTLFNRALKFLREEWLENDPAMQ